MKGCYIERHNEAARRILRSILQGRSTPGCVVADISPGDDLPPGVHTNRPPPWLLPSVPAEDRDRLRPDIMIIDG